MFSQRDDIIAYFRKLDRRQFLESDKGAAAVDMPVSIGYGQTISQPSLVLTMTLALDLSPDARVLELGTGSGYQTAMLAAFAGEVYTVERIEVFYHAAKKRLNAKGFTNIYFKHDDGSYGWPAYQPYDRMMVTASVSQIPEELLSQLALGGRMIIPVGEESYQLLKIIDKDTNGEITSSVMEDVAFVRLKGEYE